MVNEEPKKENIIPKNEIEVLARCLFPYILEYFESAEGQREFTQWRQTNT
ncbi:hypothetical protein [Anaerotignum propionicum]|uniref:Uncharacterized protein n=1 Tax=Anaerotignum propionicum DSM 1682 TaxID=991789 RepID=A0A0X8VCY7_ANAPI|nr:hypothetical protein [Anaerotignum propionicum]AMJ40500.1 hypothetical protein CPRO_09000 [Anaerotignum propionicum DSM 1682]SHE40384.1 hypothetical protein SAMN02745151_00583 [[Clostridium] propionicum DSM 1682] [Anaerotignum propionicum DSM 1682]